MSNAQNQPCRNLLTWDGPWDTWIYCDRPATVRDQFAYPETWYCRRCFYRNYLKSRRWENRRDRELRRANRQCERCHCHATRTAKGNWAGLNVHHLTYDRLGDEADGDLVVLCRSCHQQEHGVSS